MHGFAGFDELFIGIDELSFRVKYFYQIVENLERGGATVYTPWIQSFADNTKRGETLLAKVKAIIANTKVDKVHLIGHSQGALASRYVASKAPSLVFSVTSVGGVNRGSKVADFILASPSLSTLLKAYTTLLKPIGWAFGIFGQEFNHSALKDAIEAVSTDVVTEFNEDYPEGLEDDKVKNVRYFSWTGSSTFTYCYRILWVGPWICDVSDYFFDYFSNKAFNSEERNDGMVSVDSARLGHFIGNYDMNHADEINHIYGRHGDDDPVTIYRQHANRLKRLEQDQQPQFNKQYRKYQAVSQQDTDIDEETLRDTFEYFYTSRREIAKKDVINDVINNASGYFNTNGEIENAALFKKFATYKNELRKLRDEGMSSIRKSDIPQYESPEHLATVFRDAHKQLIEFQRNFFTAPEWNELFQNECLSRFSAIESMRHASSSKAQQNRESDCQAK